MIDAHKIRGKIAYDYPLKDRNWFRVGGNAQIYFEPDDEEDLRLFLSMNTKPITLLGGGSNVLISDDGIKGVVIHLGKGFSQCSISENIVQVGGGFSLIRLSEEAAKHSLTGFEGFCRIPGTIGGGIRTNAGAYGAFLSDRMLSLNVIDFSGEKKEIEVKGSSFFEYRKSKLPYDCIVISSVLSGEKAEEHLIRQKMQENAELKAKTQPLGVRTAGSTFKNPEGFSAWKLIAESGLQGYILGGAQVSLKHANFIENLGEATAQDISNLCHLIQTRVYEEKGIKLDN